MSTVETIAYTGAAIVNRGNPAWRGSYSEAGVQISMPSASYYDLLLLRFPDIPSAIRYKKLISAKIQVEAKNDTGDAGFLYPFALASGFYPENVTWNTMPQVADDPWGYAFFSSVAREYTQKDVPETYRDGSASVSDPSQIALVSKRALQSTSFALRAGYGGRISVRGAPVLIVEVDESVTITSKVEVYNSPTSGWVDKTKDTTFYWALNYAGDVPCPGKFIQASATFYWKQSTGSSWNSVEVSGPSGTVTIPANSFARGSVLWYVVAMDTQGTTTQTPVYEVSTNDQNAVAAPVSPSEIIESTTSAIQFRWAAYNPSGSTITKSELQWSPNGSSGWTTFATINGSGTSYTAPAGTFSAGSVFWRVRAYNADNTAGSWSKSAVFTAYGASAAPSVLVDAVPFATVRWQSSGQQAYKIAVDGKQYGPFFGVAQTFALPDYLEDGEHVASVSVQNSYGLWSAPGTSTFSIQNDPDGEIALAGTFGRDAVLHWAAQDVPDDYFIYRDGVKIGHTTEETFSDRIVLGFHSWHVIAKQADGNYTRSNFITGVLRSPHTAIAALSGGSWIELRLTEESESRQEFTWSRAMTLRHMAGSVYPMPERGPYEDAGGAYTVSFADLNAAQAFEALKGLPVILKSPGENVVVGCFGSFRKIVKHFFTTYEFELQAIRFEDYIDDANG